MYIHRKKAPGEMCDVSWRVTVAFWRRVFHAGAAVVGHAAAARAEVYCSSAGVTVGSLQDQADAPDGP